jgi:hypothetical protein
MSDKHLRAEKDLMGKAKVELASIVDEMTKLARKVKKDFKDNPTEDSGSIIQVHEESPYLDENLPDKGWNRVLKPGIPLVPTVNKTENK